MTKREVIWLLIRIAGLWFLWQSLESVFSVISTYMIVSDQSELLSRSAAFLLQTTIKAGLYLAIGLYCLGAGQVFYYLLNRQPETVEPSTVTQLGLGNP